MSAPRRLRFRLARSRRWTAGSATSRSRWATGFRAVDVLLGDMGGWAAPARFPIESERVNAYFDRVLARPARARAQANGGSMK